MELKALQQQTQKLKMTAELRQAISILQFSSQELADFIREQALENPLIDLQERVPKIAPDYIKTKHHKGKKNTTDTVGLIADKEVSLRDDLLQQTRYLSIDKVLIEIVTYLILQLDDDGYLRDDLELIANELNQSFENVLKALEILQSLEPAGIGARDLEECLLLQVDPEDSLTRSLISNHLVDIARGHFESIQEQLSLPLDDIKAAVLLIQSLNPKPGSVVEKEHPKYIRPDVVVEKTDSGYELWIVDNGQPDIRVNQEYNHLITSTEKNEATQYIQNKYKQYLWLVKSIEQRRTTLLKVANTIMDRQRRFLEWGPKAMAPLTLKEIAEELDIHESTVSRAVKQKYVQTPFGIFDLKAFFTSKIRTEGVSDISSVSVKILIRELIESEDRNRPLSDQNIVDVLKNTKGIDISRRAIAKYRTALKIPSSSKRKNYH
jgi:RNA polymerase sigma-54 factor